MTKLEKMERVSSWADVYADMDLMIKYIDENGEEDECLYSEFEVGSALFEIVGYICPECLEPVYLDDFDDKAVNECPVCGFDFWEEM